MSVGDPTPTIRWMQIKLLTVPQVTEWAQFRKALVERRLDA